MGVINKLLIANRGEIACRIIRTCRELGITAVSVYSDADAQARHVLEADEAVRIGPAAAVDSYLNMDAIIEAARRVGADAVHPGYGFLAENGRFARACTDAGLTFVGPSAAAIDAMGNKSAARQLVAEHGVPVVPGYDGDEQTDERLLAEGNRIGFPLMVKAAAGGGGKGMRLVPTVEALPEALAAARREAAQAFGSDQLILERAIARPRHVEVQVLGDQHGTLLHFGERDCSIQRRHQKVVEEAPAPGLSADLRRRLGETAVLAAQTVNYANAGTVEFLLDENENVYFLEMNTRIQVEHPVTEMVLGIDLVAWQIRIAEGELLPWNQAVIQPQGHAVEVRLYAENPASDFLPVTGRIARWAAPTGAGIRVDSGVRSADMITIYYDPMIAKLIAHGPDRKTAVRRLRRALDQTVLHGLVSNRPFLQAILAHPAFEAGEVHTAFLPRHLPDWQPSQIEMAPALVAASIWQLLRQSAAGHWRNSPNRPLRYAYVDAPSVWLTPTPAGFDVALGDAEPLSVTDVVRQDNTLTMTLGGHRRSFVVTAEPDSDRVWVQWAGETAVLTIQSLLPRPKTAVDAGGSLRAPMPGTVIALLVSEGEAVESGTPLLKLEAMKMEHTIRSAGSGVIEQLFYQVGDRVEADALLLKIRAA